MPPVIVAVAAFAAEAIGVAVAGAIGITGIGASIIGAVFAFGAVSLASSALGLNKPPSSGGKKAASDTSQNRTQTVKQAVAPHMLIPGFARLGGVITFIESNGGAGALTTQNNQYLVMVVTFAAHPCASLRSLYFNENWVPLDGSGNAITPPDNPDGTKPQSFAGFAKAVFGDGTIAGDAAFQTAMAAWSAKWTPDCLQAGRAKVAIQLAWDNNTFASTGIPNVSAILYGRMVVDPRDDQIAISTVATGLPGLITTSSPHGLAVGNMAYLGSSAAKFTVGGIARELIGAFEVNTAPSSTTLTLRATDSNAMHITTSASLGWLRRMHWTDNAALVTADYICDPTYGFGSQFPTEIDETALISAANSCDEMVDLAALATTFTANATTDVITWTEDQPAGSIPSLAQFMVSSSGTLPAGLSAGTIYYFASQGGNTGYVCTSLANAQALPPVKVNITDSGTGTHTLTLITTFTRLSISPTNALWLQNTNLRILTGTKVRVATTGTLPSPLAPATDYYALVTTTNMIYLASSLVGARAVDVILLTDNGSGTHTITALAEPRYTTNGQIDTSQTREQVAQELQASMAGYIIPAGGIMSVLPGVYRTPTVTLSESDLRDAIQVVTLTSSQQSFNSVKGIFVDPFASWQPTDFPPWQISAYVAEDNGEIVWNDIQLPLTLSHTAAQRIASITLERVRRELAVKFPAKFTAFSIAAADDFMIDNTRWGWDEEIFECQSWSFTVYMDPNGVPALGCDLIGKQNDGDVFAWSTSNQIGPHRQAATSLPNPFKVAPPSGLTLASGSSYVIVQPDGSLVSRVKVSWTSPADLFVTNGGFIELQYKKHADSIWLKGAPVPGDETFTFIENGEIGTGYDIAIRSRNSIGALSDYGHPWQQETDNYTIAGNTTVPDAPTDLAAYGSLHSIRLQWSIPSWVALSYTEIWIGTDSSLGDATLFCNSKTNNKVIENAGQGVTYYFWVRSVDTSGNTSTFTGPVSAAAYFVSGAVQGQNNGLIGIKAIGGCAGFSDPHQNLVGETVSTDLTPNSAYAAIFFKVQWYIVELDEDDISWSDVTATAYFYLSGNLFLQIDSPNMAGESTGYASDWIDYTGTVPLALYTGSDNSISVYTDVSIAGTVCNTTDYQFAMISVRFQASLQWVDYTVDNGRSPVFADDIWITST